MFFAPFTSTRFLLSFHPCFFAAAAASPCTVFAIHFPFTTHAFPFHSFSFLAAVHGRRIFFIFHSLPPSWGVGRPWADSRIPGSWSLPSLKPLLAIAQTSTTFPSKVSLSRSCRIASYCLRFTPAVTVRGFSVAEAKVVQGLRRRRGLLC